MFKVLEKESLAPLTTLRIGGSAEFFATVSNSEELEKALSYAKIIPGGVTIIGGGSNLLIADEGLRGLVIAVRTKGIRIDGETVIAAAGESLDAVVRATIRAELGGLESLTDIPGTVGGAIYGNAGAYGRAISDFLSFVTIHDGQTLRKLSREECAFVYRGSIFKERPWVLVDAGFSLIKLHQKMLESIAQAIRAHRGVRYPKRLKIPGSFFKNVEIQETPQEVLARIPRYGIVGNKVQAGFLLESIGALGVRKGRVSVAEHHANLLINRGGASAEEFLSLATELWARVYEHYGISLQPEVQLLGFKKDFFSPREFSHARTL